MSTDTMLSTIEQLAHLDYDFSPRRFFGLLADIASTHPTLINELLFDIYAQRPSITDEHLAGLLFSSAQFVSDYAFDLLSTPCDTTTINTMHTTLLSLLHSSRHALVTLCSEQNICTTITNRYALLKILVNFISGRERMKVLDVGCSIGIGLMGINTEAVTNVHTADLLLERVLQQPTRAHLFGLDIKRPTIEWLQASYLPEYRDERQRVGRLHAHLMQVPHSVTFVAGDALRLSEIPGLQRASFDLIWTSNLCYELEGNADALFEGIKSLLRPQGVWAYAYYRHQQPGYTDADPSSQSGRRNPYVVQLYALANWEHSIEVLESPNDEVRSVRRGRHFDAFYHGFTPGP